MTYTPLMTFLMNCILNLNLGEILFVKRTQYNVGENNYFITGFRGNHDRRLGIVTIRDSYGNTFNYRLSRLLRQNPNFIIEEITKIFPNRTFTVLYQRN